MIRRWIKSLNIKRTFRAVDTWTPVSLELWRQSERLKYSQELLKQPLFRLMLGVLQNSIPMPRLDSQEHAAIDGAVVQGYMLCLNNIYRMATPMEPTLQEIPVTYDKPMEEAIAIEEE